MNFRKTRAVVQFTHRIRFFPSQWKKLCGAAIYTSCYPAKEMHVRTKAKVFFCFFCFVLNKQTNNNPATGMLLNGTKILIVGFFTLSSSRKRSQKQERTNLNFWLFSEVKFPHGMSQGNVINKLNYYSGHGRSIFKEKWTNSAHSHILKKKTNWMAGPLHEILSQLCIYPGGDRTK